MIAELKTQLLLGNSSAPQGSPILLYLPAPPAPAVTVEEAGHGPREPAVLSPCSHQAASAALGNYKGVTVHLAGSAMRPTHIALEGLGGQDSFRGKAEASTCNFLILSHLLHCGDGRVEGEGTQNVAEIHQTQKLH